MSNDELDVERRAGIDMLPAGESFEWNPAPRTMALRLFAQTSASRCPSRSPHRRVSTDSKGTADCQRSAHEAAEASFCRLHFSPSTQHGLAPAPS